jgi:hypothetical protein
VITIDERQFPSINPLIGESEGLHAEFQGGHVALLGGRPADSGQLGPLLDPRGL